MSADKDFDRLDRQARRIGCHVVSAEALEAFERDARELERLRNRPGLGDPERVELKKLRKEVKALRGEVSILHHRLKSPWGRLVAKWHRRKVRREAEREERDVLREGGHTPPAAGPSPTVPPPKPRDSLRSVTPVKPVLDPPLPRPTKIRHRRTRRQ